jgi:hypothetical protein
MTPLQAAKAHCANYQADGSCLGVAFRDDLSMYRFRNEGLPCVFLHGRCEGCQYFEEIVLPQVSAAVAAEYRKSLPADAKTTVRPQRSIKLCPDCHKRELEPRQRYCATCAKTRKRDSKCRHMRAKRRLDVEKQEISPIGAEALTKAKITIGYHNPKPSILASSYSTRP